jgi:hypothetical protein
MLLLPCVCVCLVYVTFDWISQNRGKERVTVAVTVAEMDSRRLLIAHCAASAILWKQEHYFEKKRRDSFDSTCID